jgi:hypothetical protein
MTGALSSSMAHTQCHYFLLEARCFRYSEAAQRSGRVS